MKANLLLLKYQRNPFVKVLSPAGGTQNASIYLLCIYMVYVQLIEPSQYY